MPELRRDPVVERWVITSTERTERPSDFQRQVHTSRRGPCPFCPGNEAMTPPEVMSIRPDGFKGDQVSWALRVVPNRFPALTMEGRLTHRGEGLYELMRGMGTHEVIIETRDHQADMGMLSERQFEIVLRAYRDRIVDLKKDRRLRHILIFKNQGLEAGATMEHSHSQLIALPVVPRAVVEELNGVDAYYRARGRCVYCDIIRQETEGRRRIVSESEHFVAICPFAARFAFESWILPKRHFPSYEDGTEREFVDLSRCLRDTIRRLNGVLKKPPFNYFVHSSPTERPPDDPYHWHIEIVPKLTQLAGFELGSGFYINPVMPEQAALRLREAGC